MSDELQFGTMREEEMGAVSRIISLAFAGTREGSVDWLTKAGIGNVRVLRPKTGDPAACLLRIPMGEYFGGKSIPLIGIAGVGVAPEFRGKGVAGRMMAAGVKEMAEEGCPLSGLYPATQPLYQRVGYEQAGHRFEIRMPTRGIDLREKTLRVRPIEDADESGIRACYAKFASAYDGPLDRGPYVWARVRTFRDNVYHGFAAVDDAGAIEGYLFLNQTRKSDGRQDLALTDLVFATERAGRRLLSFLEDFSSIADDIVFCAGPLHPALYLMAEQRYTISLKHFWMLRVLDVKGAFEARGYPLAVRGEAHLDVRDELVTSNAGKWVVRVEGGRASVERGGKGSLRMEVRTLAPLFSGYLSVAQLAGLGKIEGDAAALAAAAGVFPSGTPWMSDMY